MLIFKINNRRVNNMAVRNKTKEIQEFIIYNVEAHPTDIAKLITEKFGISRVAAINHLRLLEKGDLLEAIGLTKARHYKLKYIAFDRKVLTTAQLREDEVWSNFVKPLFEGVKDNILGICAHGFTEMLNNVIDHSESSTVEIVVTRSAAEIRLRVRDYGIGIFNKIQKALNLSEPQHAILELTKGKLTTDKTKHTGEGIFFTSRMFDHFAIGSGTLIFGRTRRADRPTPDWIWESDQAPITGTNVDMSILTNSTQTTKEVFDKHSAEFDEFGFSKTFIPLKLMKYEGEQLISRSQAKRLMTHVDQFKEVVLDFEGIAEIGQAFADEVFRVYRKEHPSVHVYPLNTTEDVKKMIKRITSVDPNDPLNNY